MYVVHMYTYVFAHAYKCYILYICMYINVLIYYVCTYAYVRSFLTRVFSKLPTGTEPVRSLFFETPDRYTFFFFKTPYRYGNFSGSCRLAASR